MSVTFTRSRVLPSDPAAINGFCLEIRAGLEGLGVGKRDRFACELVCRELLQNAFEHGNRGLTGAAIRVLVTCDGRTFNAEIGDEGAGFDPEAAAQNAENAGQNRENGRGLAILERYATTWGWLDGGRTALVTRELGQGSMQMNGEADFTPGRDLVASAIETMKETIKERVAATAGTFTMDLNGVEMVDSRGLGLLIATNNSLTSQGRRLRIINAGADIVDLFRIMRLDRHFLVE